MFSAICSVLIPFGNQTWVNPPAGTLNPTNPTLGFYILNPANPASQTLKFAGLPRMAGPLSRCRGQACREVGLGRGRALNLIQTKGIAAWKFERSAYTISFGCIHCTNWKRKKLGEPFMFSMQIIRFQML